MRQRMSRNHKSRRGFKVDSLLDRKTKRTDISAAIPAKYMNLTFLGFFDKTLESHPKTCQVETSILKVSHKKRKDSSSPVFKVSFGSNDVPINPSDSTPPPQVPTACIPTDSFSLSNGSLVKSYILLLKVQYMSGPNSDIQEDEPAVKRRKSTNSIIRTFEETKLYCSELTVYDKHNRCLLTDGDYELGLNEFTTNIKTSPKKHTSWENIADLDTCDGLDNFNSGPSLKFKLSWSDQQACGLVDRPKPYSISDNKETDASLSNSDSTLQRDRFHIIYQFVYNNNSRQQTEACEDLHCPWCSVDCGSLYSLLKHLKLCHPRFAFTYVPIQGGARIDVAINELYDGSYAGSPHELAAQPGGRGSGPVRRATVTHVLVSRPNKRPRRCSLSEFLGDEHCGEAPRPFVAGHSRLYHHTSTCLPVQPREMEADSEGEPDPEWLRAKTAHMIDEFTDVNEGEKELMKMWNLHVMRHGFVGDCQIPLASTMFIQERGSPLLLNNLYRNFLLHLCSLFDFGLISPVCLYGTVKKLQELVGETGEIRSALTQSRVAQMDSWTKTTSARVPPPVRTPQTAGGGRQNQASRRRVSEQHPPSKKRLSLALKKEESRNS